MLKLNDPKITLDVDAIKLLLKDNQERAAQITKAIIEGMKEQKQRHDLIIFCHLILSYAENTLSPQKLKEFEDHLG
ncbi:hypothetical protein [Succinivibrio sp.]|uniref:hypothetical protein n=1 Tax=Succinivibrio sp. TaxID=2053619 RepID=UPI0025EA6A55|nr:hypothetical protein [Succinivibrio sp.]MBQ9220034.1 hypothetical protein [Succinivibrio sp.]